MNHITIIKFGAIGDVIQAAAAINELKLNNPDLRINWVIGQALSELLVGMKVADNVIAVDDQMMMLGSPTQKLRSLLDAFQTIFRHTKRCDQLYIAQSNWKYCIFAAPLLIKNPALIFGHIKRFFPALNQYRVSEYFRFLSGKNINEEVANAALLRIGKNVLATDASNKFILEGGSKWVALVPGGSKNMLRDDFLRRWPIENYVQVAQQCINDGYRVVLIGSKTDEWVKPYFSKLNVLDLIGKTNIDNVVDIFSKAHLVISHDTGPLHLATLTSTPLIAIFGPTPAAAVIPIHRKSLAFFKAAESVPCAPCYNGVDYAACIDPICIKSTSVEMVYWKSKQLLSGEAIGAQ